MLKKQPRTCILQVLGFLLPFLPLSGIIKLEYRFLFYQEVWV